MIKFIKTARIAGKSWREIWAYLFHGENFETHENIKREQIWNAILSELGKPNLIVEELMGPPKPVADFGGCWRL